MLVAVLHTMMYDLLQRGKGRNGQQKEARGVRMWPRDACLLARSWHILAAGRYCTSDRDHEPTLALSGPSSPDLNVLHQSTSLKTALLLISESLELVNL